MLNLTVKRDTAVFSDRQWYIEGYTHPDCWFSTEKDAAAAVAVAYAYGVARTDKLAEMACDFLNNVVVEDD